MKNTNNNNTVKVKRTNKKIAASVCAVVAAAAMATGIAVFTASANTSDKSPVKPFFSSISVQDMTELYKAENTEKKDTSDKTEKPGDTQKSAQPQTNNKDNEVNQNGKHPGESGYNYQPVAQTNNTASVQQKAPLVIEVQPASEQVKQQAAPAQTQTPTAPAANTNDKQPAAETNNAVAPTEIFSGKFTDVNNKDIVLNIAKADMYNTAYCMVNIAKGNGEYAVYSFMANVAEDKMYYTGATVTEITYDAKGEIVSSKALEDKHEGHIVMTKEGYVWVDSDGTHCVFAYK